MKNKNVGYLIIGISILIMIIILLFNNALKDIVTASCSHGSECSMYESISLQTYVSLAIAGFIFLLGIFFVFAKENEKIIIKKEKVKEKKKKLDLTGLESEEKKVIKLLQEENGAIFQSTLMEKLEIGKVKATRLLDKLEAKQFIERKRRGMNNVVVLRK